MTPAGAVEVGRRVFLRAPTARDRDEFLALMSLTERGLLVCQYPDSAIAGVINVSQIFYSGFRSAYLGFYAGAHERWAITAEDLRR